MNRTDRLFAILLLLRNTKRIRAQDLAQRFEVSERTIYRDMLALNEAGVPIVSLPGQGYELVEGFYLPPLMLTPDEASALFLAGRLLGAQARGRVTRSADRALSKIAAILPPDARRQAESLMAIIEFYRQQARFDLDDPQLTQIQKAIGERRVLDIRYHSYSHDQTTERQVEPHSLTYSSGAWYINGYCRLRQAPRSFRLERVDNLKILAETFEPRALNSTPSEPVGVRVRFAAAVARWVRERQHYAFQREEPAPDGAMMIYRVDDLAELIPWLLSWGASAEVIEPQELRRQIREQALKLAALLT